MASQSLVVGAAGQVGVALTTLLGQEALPSVRAASPHNSLVIDLAALAHDPGLAPRLLAPLALNAVYCIGGATDVERCETDIHWAMDTNCFGPAALAAAAAARHLPFVYISTDYVFDGEHGPYAEDAPTHPLSVYGRSKLEGEQRVLDAHPDALILRTANVYGPDRQRKNFLYTLRRLLASGQPMRIASDMTITPTYNQDLAAAAIELVRSGRTGLFHAAGPEVISRLDFALLAARILGLDPALLQPVPLAGLNLRARRPRNAALLIGKLTTALPHLRMRPNAEAIATWAEQDNSSTIRASLAE